MDRFEEMRTFSAVARHGVNGTARAFHIAPSAVSRRIRDLETRIGTRLFARANRSMILTEAGQNFLKTARDILNQLEEAEVRMRDAQGVLVGRLRIAAPMSFGMQYVMPALNDFLESHPRLDLDLNLDDRRVDILRDGFDLTIRVGDLENSALRARRLGSWPFVVAASPRFVEHYGTIETPSDLNGAPGLLYAPKAHPEIWEAEANDGSKHKAILEPRLVSNNGDALREAAIKGLGVLCEPRFIIGDALDDGRLVQLLADHDFGEVGAYAIWPPHDYMPAKTRAAIDHLAAVFGKLS